MNNDIILSVENISKQYQLGVFGSGTIGGDVQRWWYKIRGKEDPFLKIGETNERSVKSDSKFVWALQDINFEVKRGEVLGIIGKNGAGKSTLLKLLSRVTGPTTGRIRSRGRMASLLEVGTGFHPELTGLENIYLNGAILGMTKVEIKRKLEEIIDFSGIARYIDTPVKRYSTGMTVRLGFAVAAFLEPEILVVDEVLAVGDVEFQKKAIGKMKEVSEGGGRTVLFVSHNMASIRTLCTSGIVLENGHISFKGSSGNAISHYLSQNTGPVDNNLEKRTVRFGNGKIRIIKAEFYNKNGEQVNTVISGDFIRLKISFHINEMPVEKIILAFNIFDKNEDLKTLTVTDEMNIDINGLVKRGYLFVDFERVLLRGGEYDFKFVLSEGNTWKENHLDRIERACSITVLPGDFYRTGKLNRSYNASILPCNIG